MNRYDREREGEREREREKVREKEREREGATGSYTRSYYFRCVARLGCTLRHTNVFIVYADIVDYY